MTTKSGLAITLSKLAVFRKPKVSMEQYTTDSEIAADMLWNAYLLKDIDGRRVADLGSGTGILTIAAAILGADATGYEKDVEAIAIAVENAQKVRVKVQFIKSDISEIKGRYDTIVQNPPFGTRDKHKDKEFLLKAFSSADVIYSIHKESTKEYLETLAEKHGFFLTHTWNYSFPLKRTLPQHRKAIERIRVSCLRLRKVRDNP